MSSSTPNSSVSNMACLPEVDPELVAFGEDHTGVHPSQVAAVTRQVRSINVIYVSNMLPLSKYFLKVKGF